MQRRITALPIAYPTNGTYITEQYPMKNNPGFPRIHVYNLTENMTQQASHRQDPSKYKSNGKNSYFPFHDDDKMKFKVKFKCILSTTNISYLCSPGIDARIVLWYLNKPILRNF